MKRFVLALTLIACLVAPARAGVVPIPPEPCDPIVTFCPDDGGTNALAPFDPWAELYGDAVTYALTI